MNRQHILVGSFVILLCLILFSRERWFLANTKKGRRLTRWFGPDKAIWVLRGLLALCIVFGGLLATGVIRPIQW